MVSFAFLHQLLIGTNQALMVIMDQKLLNVTECIEKPFCRKWILFEISQCELTGYDWLNEIVPILSSIQHLLVFIIAIWISTYS